MSIAVTFWGTRGSLSRPGKDFVHFGGNTSCVSLDFDTHRIILDAGSGLKVLGDQWNSQQKTIHLFLSHFHYDHLIGLPFFKPFWSPEYHFHFYTALFQDTDGFEKIFQKFLTTPFMPMEWNNTPTSKTYHLLNFHTPYTLPHDVLVQACYLNHPGDAAGYRFDFQGKSVCYITDFEHTEDTVDTKLQSFIHGADLVIYDGFFNNHNYIPGWGHSTWEYGVKLCEAARVKKLAIFHHHFDATDKDLLTLEKTIAKEYPWAFVSHDGLHIELS